MQGMAARNLDLELGLELLQYKERSSRVTEGGRHGRWWPREISGVTANWCVEGETEATVGYGRMVNGFIEGR